MPRSISMVLLYTVLYGTCIYFTSLLSSAARFFTIPTAGVVGAVVTILALAAQALSSDPSSTPSRILAVALVCGACAAFMIALAGTLARRRNRRLPDARTFVRRGRRGPGGFSPSGALAIA